MTKRVSADKQTIIDLFSTVQQVPFYFLKRAGPESLLEINKGGCAQKALFLGNRFREIGLLIRYFYVQFSWQDLPVPQEIIDMRESLFDWHLAFKALIDGKRVIVDPTWDIGLKKLGFPVTLDWDGRSDTLLAVEPIQEREISSAFSWLMSLVVKYRWDREAEFHTALNEWLEKERRRK